VGCYALKPASAEGTGRLAKLLNPEPGSGLVGQASSHSASVADVKAKQDANGDEHVT